MGNQLKIKVDIAGRLYPLNIERDQEEIIRKSALNINKQIKVFQSKYNVRDMQDPLAMICIDLATRLETQKGSTLVNEQSILKKVNDINYLLEDLEDKYL